MEKFILTGVHAFGYFVQNGVRNFTTQSETSSSQSETSSLWRIDLIIRTIDDTGETWYNLDWNQLICEIPRRNDKTAIPSINFILSLINQTTFYVAFAFIITST